MIKSHVTFGPEKEWWDFQGMLRGKALLLGGLDDCQNTLQFKDGGRGLRRKSCQSLMMIRCLSTLPPVKRWRGWFRKNLFLIMIKDLPNSLRMPYWSDACQPVKRWRGWFILFLIMIKTCPTLREGHTLKLFYPIVLQQQTWDSGAETIQ